MTTRESGYEPTEPMAADIDAPAPAAPTGRELEARIEADKAQIADALRMFSAKAESELDKVGETLSDFALPACGAAALLGYWLSPRGRPSAVIHVESPGREPAILHAESPGVGWKIWLAGGLALAGAAGWLWNRYGGEEPAGEPPLHDAGFAVPPGHIGYAPEHMVESGASPLGAAAGPGLTGGVFGEPPIDHGRLMP